MPNRKLAMKMDDLVEYEFAPDSFLLSRAKPLNETECTATFEQCSYITL